MPVFVYYLRVPTVSVSNLKDTVEMVIMAEIRVSSIV